MTMGHDHGGGVPDWRLERHLLGELPAGEAAAVRDAIARDADVRERLAALERSSGEILRRAPAGRGGRLHPRAHSGRPEVGR